MFPRGRSAEERPVLVYADRSEGGPGMPESDVYADQIGINIAPFGCALNFLLSPSTPPAGGAPAAGTAVVTVRTSLEHLKMMAFLLRRQLLQYEQSSGVQIAIPMDVLNALRIGREDWDECWGRGR